MTEDTRPSRNPPAAYTHKATLQVFSNGQDNLISVRVFFDPDMEGTDVEKLGYFPAAYQFMGQFIVPAIEEGYLEWAAGPLYQMESPSHYDN